MLRLGTIRRRLLLGAGSVLVVAGLSLCVVHTQVVRRFALVRIQALLGNTQGIDLQAGGLDYNLFQSRYELRDVSVRGARLTDMPAPAQAKRIVVVVPFWDLIHGSLDKAAVGIEGLSVRLITDRSGRSNVPTIGGSGGGGGQPAGPAVTVTGAEFYLRDDRSGLVLQLPAAHITTRWDAVGKAYGIGVETAGGRLQWNDLRLPLDRVQVKSALTAGGFSIESLQITSGRSNAAIQGVLSGTPARIEASASLNLDAQIAMQILAPGTRADGGLQAQISASGPLDAILLRGNLRSERLTIGKIRLQPAGLSTSFDTGTGQLDIVDLTSGVFSGRLKASGRVWTGTKQGRSELKLGLQGIDAGQAARAFGASGIPSHTVAVQLAASCRGLNWRSAEASGTVQMPLARVAFRGAVSGNTAHVGLQTSVGGSAGVDGETQLNLRDHSLAGTLNGTVASMAQLGGDLERLLGYPAGSLLPAGLDGAARWKAELGGKLTAPSANVTLEASGVSAGGWSGAEVQLDAGYSPERIQVRDAQIRWQGQQVKAEGEIGGASAGSALNLTATVTSPSITPALKQLGVTAPIEADLRGEVRLRGTLSQPAVEAALRVGTLTAYGAHFSRAGIDAHWETGTVTLRQFSAEQDHDSGEPGHLEVSGSFETADSRYAVHVAGRNLLPPDSPVTGTLSLTADGQGTLSDPDLRAEIRGTGVRIGQQELGDVAARVDASQHHANLKLSIPALHADAMGTVALQGALPFEFTLDAKDTKLATPLETSFDAAVRASGSLSRPAVERATASLRNVRVIAGGQEIAGDGPAELSYADGCIHVGRLALKAGDSTLQLSGEVPVDETGRPGSVAVTGTVHLDSLAQFLPGLAPAQIAGTAELNARLSGTAARLEPEGSIAIRDAAFRIPSLPVPVEGLGGEVKLTKGAIELTDIAGKAGSGTLHITGWLPLNLVSDVFPAAAATSGQPARVSAELANVRLSGGSAARPVTAAIGLKIAAEAPALSLPAVRASVQFDELSVTTRDSELRQTAPTRLAIADSTANLEQLDLKGTNSSLQGSGSLGLTGDFPLRLDVSGQADLAALSVIAPAIEAAGTARLDVRASGTLAAPQTTGFVELDQATLVIPNPRIQATGIKLRADLVGDHITLKDFNGNLNGGTFAGGGDLTLGAGGIRNANLFLKGKDIFEEFPTGLKTTSSVDAKLVSRKEQLVLEGQIEVQEGFFESPLDALARSPEGVDALVPEELPARGKASNPVGLDLKITTKRPVEMNNNLGTISGTADLRLAGTLDQVRVLGKLTLEQDGKLYFGDRVYYIERGTVRFLDAAQVTPELDIHAYTRTNDYTINLGLTGVPSEITTTFTSDPPLSRDDVISVLLTGKTVADNRGVDVRTLEAYSVATGAMNAALSSRLHHTLGVSRVSIQPSAIAAESNPGTRVTITQDFTRTFRLLYSMNLNDSADQIWVGEYDLSRSLTTRLVKQTDNTYRGEFRHDIRFGKSTYSAAIAAVRGAQRRVSSVAFTGGGHFSNETLAKKFKVKPGQKYDPLKVRKASDRLGGFLFKKGYLESRVRLDREEAANSVAIEVRIELGPVVEMAFQGVNLPRGQRSKLRRLWHAGISDMQRPQAAKDAILDYFAKKGYLRARVDPHLATDGDRKTVSFDLRPGIHYRDVKVVIQGAPPERAKDIRSLIGQRRLEISADRYPERLTGAVVRFYQQRGYLNAKVAAPVFDLDEDGRRGQIVVPITEGPAYHIGSIEFSGNQSITAETLRSGLPVETGQVFEPARLEPAATAIRTKYGKLGFRAAHIEYTIARHDDRAAVDLTFQVAENRQTAIRSIRITGNRQTSDKFVQRRLAIAEGQLADTSKIAASVGNLALTGAYASADIQPDTPETANPPELPEPPEPRRAPDGFVGDKNLEYADFAVLLAEPKPFRLLYGGLYDSGSGPGFILDFQNRNTFGAGRTLGLRARYDSDTQEARLYLTQPFFKLQRITTTASAYYIHEIQNGQDFPTDKLGVSLQQDWPLPKKLLLSYGIRFEYQRAWLPVDGFLVPTRRVYATPLTFTISRDVRDSFLDATRGSFTSHSFEYAPGALGSQYPYLRYYGQYFKYFPLIRPRPVLYGETPNRSRLVFATGTRIGMQKGFNSNNLVLSDRFYAGGGTTIRGFQQDALGPTLANGTPIGGNASFIFNEELRYPLFWIFDAVSFVDVGNVFPQVNDFRFGELRKAGGFGLRVRNPFVVLRFDYGFKLDRRPGEKIGAFFFSIGQAF
ncbi:MAG TPA: translocation/assembly module TamB domain-containing protein [Candidatus Acidoferrales bacterium]|nr:translocation/assembly module TamB domain-containing protein [Candidatus Acidoferrales bacterium]